MGSSIAQCDRKMEGWLYLIRQNRVGVQCSRMQYFVLEDNVLNCYTSVPTSKREDPIQSALLDSCVCVTDNGREKIDKNVLFMFTLYNPSNHIEQLKLGARSSEEAARWTQALLKAAMKECLVKEENVVSVSKRRWESFRLSRNICRMTKSVDWTTFSNIHSDLMTSDVIAPSPWTIFGCNNGLRLFKEAKDADFYEKYWGGHPAIMAVGVVEATSEAIFQTVLSLGPSRSEWDFCFLEGSVVEHLDGHDDIIHKQLKKDWLPWGMKKRDLLLRRYWRREDDGTYVILYHSVLHQKCRPQSGYIRACLKSGGYVISPLNQGKLSVVKHILAVDWKFWKSSLFTSSAEGITIRMLGRIAALRELFRAKLGNRQCTDFASAELRRIMSAPHTEQEEIKVEIQCGAGNSNNTGIRGETIQSSFRQSSKSGSFIQLNDAADEFYDILDEPEHEPEAIWSSEEQRQYKLSTASGFVKRLHKRAVQKKDYIDLQETLIGDTMPCSYGNTLRKDTTFNVPCSWAEADPSTFLIRSESYLCGQNKVKANGTLMQMVAADWLKSDKPEHDLGGRPGGTVQKYADRGGNEFFFIVNFQVPGSTAYSLAFYYKIDKPIESVPLLERFVKGDDAYRNSRFKVIPYISKGSWIVKQSVGKKACLVGQALDLIYFCGKNYLEVVVDIGSSTIARGIASLVLGYLTNLVIEMAFLIQGNAEEELPEFLLGTCRLNHLDASKAVPIISWKH